MRLRILEDIEVSCLWRCQPEGFPKVWKAGKVVEINDDLREWFVPIMAHGLAEIVF